ncbi:hypothetical protein [Burkholderia pyrrocinia]|uniref:hypothetical protein n=1 Tax=Burkholderia pyrrocinia TaxID=60550 RepID=UPI001048BF2F|nr:hypothetical protein [Burkholderia pyrrocinia]TDA45921.1 hypothetical protein EVG18_18735 [Burkholderia pyrrocinia]
MNKEYVARAIELAGCLLGLVVAFQAIRFCQGAIGAPILDQVIKYVTRPFVAAVEHELDTSLLYTAPPSSNVYAAGATWLWNWVWSGIYYLLGILVWLELGLLVQSCARAAARIYVVGFDQYCDEVRTARAEAEQREKIYAERERRLELQRRRRQAQQPRSGFSVGTLVAGIIIGTFLF